MLSLHLRSSPLSAVVLFLGCASGGVVPVGRARQAASTQWCTPLHSTLAAAPTFDPASLTKAVLKVSPLLTMSLPLFPRPVFGQSHGRLVFPFTLRLTDNFKIWIVVKSYSFTSFSFFSEILKVYPFFSSFWEPYALHWLTSLKIQILLKPFEISQCYPA